MTLTPDIDITGVCDYGKRTAPLTTWLPEKYAADNYSPSSFSGDELLDLCAACVRRYRVSHDPKVKRRPRPPWLGY